jgi:hypothetical protein
MNRDFLLMDARADYYSRIEAALGSRENLNYVRKHDLNKLQINGFAGAYAVLPIADCGNGRFDFIGSDCDQVNAFICEAFDDDGETVVDLVAWPLERPAHVLSMFGRCGLLGAWEAMNPAAYIFDTPLVMHRTPLDWLKADCKGAAVVTPRIWARIFLDLPGNIAAQDVQHARELVAIVESLFDRRRFVVPAQERSAAA